MNEGLTISPDPHSDKTEVRLVAETDVLTIISETSGACIDCSDCVTGQECPQLADWLRSDLERIDALFQEVSIIDQPFAIANRIRAEQE